uniref:Uncharacterized protein n=1 Tax=Pipistrellus kuhlii TaxID=59472 RepID=A0A7J8B0X3_PIPKU|nr:hypothetical protein mPipKuh1_007672 [Pipistrellus kuhlii]
MELAFCRKTDKNGNNQEVPHTAPSRGLHSYVLWLSNVPLQAGTSVLQTRRQTPDKPAACEGHGRAVAEQDLDPSRVHAVESRPRDPAVLRAPSGHCHRGGGLLLGACLALRLWPRLFGAQAPRCERGGLPVTLLPAR